jgi:hypothetical protein
MTRIVVHIDRLVLRGVAQTDADALSAEISRAVAGQLGAQSVRAPLIVQGDQYRIQAGKVAAASNPVATGKAIGRRIVSGGRP